MTRRPIVRMATRRSAGLMMYHRRGGALEVLLVHPGGPLWACKDEGAWSIPKGEYEGGAETALDAARRELAEETGLSVRGAYRSLGDVRLRSGKTISAWTVEGDGDPAALVSDTFEMEWPPRSGRRRRFPEIDRAGWFALEEARRRIHPAQRAFIDRLEALPA